MNYRLALLLTTATLAACGESERREFLYKPAYCLAGGLANLSSEECLPKKLKEDAAAVATAKLIAPAAPTVAKHVYFTEDQRLAMGYDVAEQFFTPYPKLTRSSVEISLEANAIIAPEAGRACGARETRRDIIDRVAGHITPTDINRDTAKFLSEHYSDLQLSELYRVAKAGGDLSQVPDDAFILPDATDKEKLINIKPTNGRSMGSILSFTTSRTVSQHIKTHRADIDQALAEITSTNSAKHCESVDVTPTDDARDAAAAITPLPEQEIRNQAAKSIAPAVEGVNE